MTGLTVLSVGTGSGGFPTFLIAIAAALAAFILWLELIIRSALVYFLVALSPLAFAATLWPAARGILRKLLELLIAAILSKLVISIALSIGTAALVGVAESTPADSDAGVGTAAGMGTGTLLAGSALLIMAAYSPFLLLRMIPLVEAAVVANGISRSPLRSAQSSINATSSVSSVARLAGNAGSALSSKLAGSSTSGAGLSSQGGRLASGGSRSGGAGRPAAPQRSAPRQGSGTGSGSPGYRGSSSSGNGPGSASATAPSSQGRSQGSSEDYEPSGPPPGSRPIANSPRVTSSSVGSSKGPRK